MTATTMVILFGAGYLAGLWVGQNRTEAKYKRMLEDTTKRLYHMTDQVAWFRKQAD